MGFVHLYTHSSHADPLPAYMRWHEGEPGVLGASVTGGSPWSGSPAAGRVVPSAGHGQLVFSLGSRGQPLNAEVLGPQGWIAIGDIRVGDRIIDAKAATCVVLDIAESTQDVWRVRLSDGAVVETVLGQLWRVSSERGGRRERISFFDLARLQRARTKYFVEPIRPIDFPKRELPLDPYLLGSLIGDGGFSKKQVYFATADAEMISLLRPLLPSGVSLLQRAPYQWALATRCCGRPNSVIAALRELELMGKRAERKSIPRIYKLSSLEQRTALLQGLMDTDGCESGQKPPLFTTVSDALAADVCDLVRSMGGTARMTTGPGTVFPLHWLSLSLPAGIKPFRLTRKAVRYHRQGYTRLARRIVAIDRVGHLPVRALVTDSDVGAYVSNDFVSVLDGLSFSSCHVKRIAAVARRSAVSPAV